MLADNVDAQRIKRENRRASFSSKEDRTARRLEQLHQNEFNEKAEGLLYEAGTAVTVSNRKLTFFLIVNLKASFFPIFFKLAGVITPKLYDQSKRTKTFSVHFFILFNLN